MASSSIPRLQPRTAGPELNQGNFEGAVRADSLSLAGLQYESSISPSKLYSSRPIWSLYLIADNNCFDSLSSASNARCLNWIRASLFGNTISPVAKIDFSV